MCFTQSGYYQLEEDHLLKSCSACPAGRFQSDSGRSSCEACPEGYAAPSNATSECSSCSPGFYQDRVSSSECKMCPAGYVAEDSGQSACSKCPTGRHADEKAEQCVICESGRFAGDGASQCQDCPLGYFSDEESEKCTACDSGTKGLEDRTGCETCPPGRFQSNPGKQDCKVARAGHYAEEGAESEEPCPAGRYSFREGSTSADCEGLCDAGTYCDNKGQKDPEGKKCPAGRYGEAGETRSDCTGECPRGYFCPEGTPVDGKKECDGHKHPERYCLTGRGEYSEVSDGFYTGPLDSRLRHSRHECERGYYCIGGVRNECPAGRYGDTRRLSNANCSGICDEGFFCAPGSTSPRGGSCSDSDPKYFCQEGVEEPQLCEEGYTVPETPDTSHRTGCEPCPADYVCQDGIRHPKASWSDMLCDGSSGELFVDQVEEPRDVPVYFEPPVELNAIVSWNEMHYSVLQVEESGVKDDGTDCSSDVTDSSPFNISTDINGSNAFGFIQLKPHTTLTRGMCDRYIIHIEAAFKEVNASKFHYSCSFPVTVQRGNAAPKWIGPDEVLLEAPRSRGIGFPIGDQFKQYFEDPDGDELSFSLVCDGGEDHPFMISSCSGQITVIDARLLLETFKEDFQLCVRASDNFPGDPESMDKSINIAVVPANRPPEVVDDPPELLVPVEPDDSKPLLRNALIILDAEQYDQDQDGNEWKDISEYERTADVSRAKFISDLDGRAAFEVSGWEGYIESGMDTGDISEVEGSFEFYIYPLGDSLGTVLEGNRRQGNNRWDITSENSGSGDNEVHWKNHGSSSTHLRQDKELKKHSWNHVCITYDSNAQRARIYYDGKRIAQTTSQSKYELNGDEKIRIGALESVPGEHRSINFVEPNFAISFLRIYGRELSSDEVERLYEITKDGESTSMDLLIELENWQRPAEGTRVTTRNPPIISSLINDTLVTDPDGDRVFVELARCELGRFCKTFSLTKDGALTVKDNTYLDWREPGLLPRFIIVNYFDNITEPVEATFPLHVQGLRSAPRVIPSSYEMNESFTGTVATLQAEDDGDSDEFVFTLLSAEVNEGNLESTQLIVKDTGKIVVEKPFHSFFCYSPCNCTRLHERVIITVQAEVQGASGLPGPTESAPRDIRIDIRIVNQPPRFVGITKDITVKELETTESVYDLSGVFCDREETTLVFELGDTDSHLFADHFAVSDSGILSTVKPLNFEEIRSVDVPVVVSDTWEEGPRKTHELIKVFVVDVPEPPEVETRSLVVDELTTFNDGSFGKINVTDPDIYAGRFKYSSVPSEFTFEQLSSQEHLYLDDSGNVFVAEGHVPDFTELYPDAYYEMQFRVDDVINDVSTTTSLTVTILPIPRAPVFSQNQTFRLDALADSGSEFGVVEATDPNMDTFLSFNLVSGPDFLYLDTNGRLYFVGDNDQIREGQLYNFTAEVMDSQNLATVSDPFYITITEGAQAPYWGNSSSIHAEEVKTLEIPEHFDGVVPDFQAKCVDPNDETIRYRIDTASPFIYLDIFRIQAHSGKLEVIRPNELDYETIEDTNGQIEISCVDSFDLRAQAKLKIKVKDIPEPPVLQGVDNMALSTLESDPVGTFLRTVEAWDQDFGSRYNLTFLIEYWEVPGATEVPLKTTPVPPIFFSDGHSAKTNITTGIVLDYFKESVYELNLTVVDETKLSDSQHFVFTVIYVNEPPVFNQSEYVVFVEEDATESTLIYSAFPFSHRDISMEFTFQVVIDPTNSFEFRGEALFPRRDGLFDYESKPSYAITIRVTDEEGDFDDANVTVVILNINDLLVHRLEWLPHDTSGGSNVELHGENIGPKWKSVSTFANVQSRDGENFLHVNCSRVSTSSGLWNNTYAICTMPAGVGQNLRWTVWSGENVYSADEITSSYAPPIIEDVTVWPEYASTHGGELFSVAGQRFGPPMITGVNGAPRRTPVVVEYRSSSGGPTVDGNQCNVTWDGEVQCFTADFVGRNLEFRVHVGLLDWAQASGWLSTDKRYAAPNLSDVEYLVDEVPTEGTPRAVVLRGSNFGSFPDLTTVWIANENYTFDSECSHNSQNHSYMLCDIPSGIGHSLEWRMEVAQQKANASSAVAPFAYDPPVFDSVSDRTGGKPENLVTRGRETIILDGRNFGPAETFPDDSLIVKYGVYVAANCHVISAHEEIECETVEGVGRSHNWIVMIGHQPSNVLVNKTNYHPPVLTFFSRPNGSDFQVSDLDSRGGEQIEIRGRHFGPANTPVDRATYASTNQVFVAPKCEVYGHERMICWTAPGTGTEHVWSVVIGDQQSETWTTSYHQPIIFDFEGINGTNPTSLNTGGGEWIEVIGENFGPQSMSETTLESVTYGRRGTEYEARNCYIRDHTRLRCQTVAGHGTGHVWIVRISGQSSSSSNQMTSYTPPTILDVYPTSVPTEGGQEITVVGHNLGYGLTTETEVEVRIDNEGLKERLDIGSRTLQEYLVHRQAYPESNGERDIPSSIPVDDLDMWAKDIHRIPLRRRDFFDSSEETGVQTFSFSMPEGFGMNRSIMVYVEDRPSLGFTISYDPPRIINIAPRLGQGEVEVRVDGVNLCTGPSCQESSCCGRLIVDNEIIDVDSTHYDHNSITFYYDIVTEHRLRIEVLDQEISSEEWTFRDEAPSISGQQGFREWSPFPTAGGERLYLYDVGGLRFSGEEPDPDEVEVTIDSGSEIGNLPCRDVKIEFSQNAPNNISCIVPPWVGHELDVFLKVGEQRSASGDFRISYASPIFDCVVRNSTSEIVYGDQESCENYVDNVDELSEGNVPTEGDIVIAYGANFGARELGGPNTATSSTVEQVRRDAEIEQQTHHRLVLRLPPGAGTERKLEFSVVDIDNRAQFSYAYEHPVIESVVPSVISTLPSERILIYGGNFGPLDGWTPTREVTVSGKPCEITWANHTVIECLPPPGQGDNIELEVTIEGQSTHNSNVLRYDTPKIASMYPKEGPTSGKTSLEGDPFNVTITAENLNNFGTSGSVLLVGEVDGNDVEFPVENPVFNHSHITFSLPPGYGAHLEVVVQVHGFESSDGTDTLEDAFSYSLPKVTGVYRLEDDKTTRRDCSPSVQCDTFEGQESCFEQHPRCFPTTGGVPVEVSGENFGPNPRVVSVMFGDNRCELDEDTEEPEHFSHYRLVCTLDEGMGKNLPAIVSVDRRESHGDSQSFSYDPPTISAVIPNTPDALGEEITIRGSNFGPPGGDVKVLVSNLTCEDPFIRDHDSITCVTSSDVVGPKGIQIEAARQEVMFHEWQELVITECDSDHYGLEGENCLYCPEEEPGAICPGGERHVDKVVSDEGFWRVNDTTPSDRCHEDRQSREVCPVFLPCEPKWACLEGNTCATGYEGHRCSQCAEGTHFRINGVCQKCPDHAWLLGVFLVLAAVGASVGGYLINVKGIRLGAFTIGVDYLQILAMFARTRVQWPTVLEQALQVLSFFNFNLELAAPDCYMQPPPPYEVRWLATMGLPLMALGLLLLVYAVHYLYKLIILRRPANRRHTHVNALIATFMVIMYILYLFLTRMTLDVFNCAQTDPPDGNYYMSGMTDIVCFESSVHLHLLFPLGCVALFVYVIAFPLGSYFLLRRNKIKVKTDQILRAHGMGRNRHDNPYYTFRRRYQRLYNLFKPGKWYWVLLILSRKFMIAVTALIFRASPIYQLSMALLVMFVAFVLQIRHQPYMSTLDFESVVNEHREKVKQGDETHVNIQAIMDEQEDANRVQAKKASTWYQQQKLLQQKREDLTVSQKGLLYLSDFNTVEAVLVASTILINLAGIMFLSARFEGDSMDNHRGEFEAIGAIAMFIIVSSFIYFVCVFVFELMSNLAPQKAMRVLAVVSCGRQVKVNSSSQKLSAKISKDAEQVQTHSNPLVGLSRIPQLEDATETATGTSESNEDLRNALQQTREELQKVKLEKAKLQNTRENTFSGARVSKVKKQQFTPYKARPVTGTKSSKQRGPDEDMERKDSH